MYPQKIVYLLLKHQHVTLLRHPINKSRTLSLTAIAIAWNGWVALMTDLTLASKVVTLKKVRGLLITNSKICIRV